MVLLEINTFGGRVDAATEIKDLILKATVPVVAYVSERLVSRCPHSAFGSRDCYGTREQHGSSRTKTHGREDGFGLKAEFEATAERWGRNRQLAGAMVDADVVVDDLVEKGKILTLSAQGAIEWGMADRLAISTHDLLTQLGYDHYEVIELTPLGRTDSPFLTNSTVSSSC